MRRITPLRHERRTLPSTHQRLPSRYRSTSPGFGGEREWDAKQHGTEKRLWDLGAGRLPFYRPAPLRRSCDIMAEALMGASSMQTKPVPVHTKTKRQREKKPVFFFCFDTEITDGIFYKTKDRLLASQGCLQVQGSHYFLEA